MAKTKMQKQKTSKQPDIAAPNLEKEPKIKKKKLKTQKLNFKSKSQIKIKTKTKTKTSSDSEPEYERIQKLLEPFSKDQLIDLVTDAAQSSSTLFAKIREIADNDISHRKIFVHGLSWDTTNKTLMSAFQKFGEIENSNVVVDKVTRKAKGYAFVTYKTRESALKALEQPKMVIDNRLVVWQLASLGPSLSQGQQQQQQQQEGNVNGNSNGNWNLKNLSGRKIYVSNVTSDVSAEKLKAFFAQFGEIESGPMGFDVHTGKFKGYALFVYRTVEGAKKALEEPNRVFEGRQLHCQKAAEGKKNAGGAAGITTAVQPVPPVYAAVAALLGQNSNVNVNPGLLSVNPSYSSLLANQNAAAAGFVNLSPLGMVEQRGMGMSMGVLGYGGMLGTHGLSSLGSGSATAMPGPYGGGSVSSGLMMQGLHYPYPDTQMGQKSLSAAAAGTSWTVG